MQNIKNIILDLGGVILDLDYHQTTAAFRNIGVADFDRFYCQKQQVSLFSDFEIGKISAGEFRLGLKQTLNIQASDTEIDQAWNAMQLDLPVSRLYFLENLSLNYNLYLYSNTNEIHQQWVREKLADLPVKFNFDYLFKETYYSYKFGHRKPHPESFTKILHLNHLNPNETLFVDDSEQHIQGAKAAGLNVIHLQNPHTLLDLEKLMSSEN
jgi:HAD superfamily hydrolase (TIGR01509 family)